MQTSIPELLNMVWPFLLMALVFYFTLYRPQKKDQQKREKMLSDLKVGNAIVTIGGIYGTILKLGEKKAIIKIAENVEIEVARTAISYVENHKRALKDE